MVRISQTISFFVDFTIYLLLVGVVSIVFSQVIPLPTPYNQMNYMSPLYCNIMLIFARFYAYYLREVCSTKKNFQDYLEPFLYINSFVFDFWIPYSKTANSISLIPRLSLHLVSYSKLSDLFQFGIYCNSSNELY